LALRTSKKWRNAAIFAKVVKFDCGRLKQQSSSYECLFFSAVASSTIDPLVASLKDARILFVLAVQTRQKCHFRPHLDQKVVKFVIKRLGQ